MEGIFVNVVLIYILVSFSILLKALMRPIRMPGQYLWLGFWVICMHIVYKLIWVFAAGVDTYELPSPLGIVYPTLLYLVARLYYRSTVPITAKTKVFLLLPIVAQVIFFSIALLQGPVSSMQMLYSNLYYGATMLSLLVYATIVTALYSSYRGLSTPLDILIRQLSALCFALVVLVYLILYEAGVSESEIGFQVRPMVYLFLAIGFALILRYLLTSETIAQSEDQERISSSLDKQPEKTVRVRLPDTLQRHICQMIDYEMHQAKLFLNPSVSLDMLSQRTAIPRYQLTEVFNRHYNKSFYQFVATARIEYAMTKIRDMDDSLTLDSLSYECGFNSKTSFNRYFKEYTGMTPSAFRSVYSQLLYAQ